MVNRTKQKELEIYHLGRFKDTYENFSRGVIVPGESPDFIVESPNGNMGIEGQGRKLKIAIISLIPHLLSNNQRSPETLHYLYHESGLLGQYRFLRFPLAS